MLGLKLSPWFLLSAGLALATEPLSIDDGVLADVGETLGTAKVIRIESHPEFQRYWLVDELGRGFAAELTRADGIHQGLCEARGLVLYPRAELVEGEPAPITVEPWCAVLATLEADQLRLGERKTGSMDGASDDAPPDTVEASTVKTVTLACGVGVLASLIWFVRRDFRRFAVVVAGALLVRLVAAEPVLWNGGGAGYEKLLLAWGQMRGAPYGQGFVVWMSPAVRSMGTTFAAVSFTNLCFSALTVGIMYRLAVVVAPKSLVPSKRKWFPIWVAVLAAVLPVAVVVSRSELMHVSGVAFAAAAVLFAAEARNGSHLAGASALMAVWAAFSTRPDLGMVVLPVMAFALSWRSIWVVLAAGALATLIVWRIELPELLQLDRLGQANTAFSALMPRVGVPEVEGSFQLFLHSAFTPAAWWCAALLGVFAAPASVRWPALAWVAASAPFLGKVVPIADAVRLQLFAQYGWIVLVAVGLARIGPAWSLLLGLGAGVYQLSGVPLRWANHDEFDFLTEVVPTLPPESVISTAAFDERNAGFIRVMAGFGPAHWKHQDETIEVEPLTVPLVYRSVGDPLPNGPAFLVRELPLRTDLDVQLAEPPVVGFYRVP